MRICCTADIRWSVLCFRQKASWTLKQVELCVTSWDLLTSLKVNRDGELPCKDGSVLMLRYIFFSYLCVHVLALSQATVRSAEPIQDGQKCGDVHEY